MVPAVINLNLCNPDETPSKKRYLPALEAWVQAQIAWPASPMRNHGYRLQSNLRFKQHGLSVSRDFVVAVSSCYFATMALENSELR